MTLGPCSPSGESSREVRKMLKAVGDGVAGTPVEEGGGPVFDERLGAWPDECPGLAETIETFVPTTVLLAQVPWNAEPRLLWDDDHVDPSRFVSAFYVAEEINYHDWGKLKVVAARAYMMPPVSAEQGRERADLMARHGKGVPLTEADGYRAHLLTGRLRPLERRLMRHMSPIDQLAVVNLLAATSGDAAFISAAGQWPDSPYVQYIASYLDRRIHRFPFDGIPDAVIGDIRNSRYYARGCGV